MLSAAPQAPAPANKRIRVIRPNAPTPDEIIVRGIHKEREGAVYRLRGAAELETTESLLTADEMDYNEETGDAEARGNVRYKNYNSGEEIKCVRAEYNVRSETGKFYEISGVIPATIEAKPRVLTSDNPFIFEGKWAERIEDRYILHQGMITSCKLPKPWWTLTGPKFDVIPNDRAIAQRALFRLRGVPLFYSPYYYKSLERQPRRSGFLMPTIANSGNRGIILGIGYYWAISRSYDMTYRPMYFSKRGLAHMVDFRGKPTQKSDFSFSLYGVDDNKGNPNNGRHEGGITLNFTGRTEIPGGWTAFANVNYLSSFLFRQAFTQTFNEAVNSQVSSIAYLTKHWNGYGLNVVYDRQENFQSIDNDNDTISIRKLPELQFFSQDRRVAKSLPLWWSFDTSAGLLRRNQLLYQTRQAMDRLDFSPRLMTAIKWKHIQLIPSISIRETHWGSTFGAFEIEPGQPPIVTGKGLWRHSFEGDAELILPSLARVYNTKGWLGDKFKHVIEPRVNFRYVGGVDNFRDTIRFDGTELVSNTNEIEISIANRFYTKKNGVSREWASWEVWHKRYFDPTFGGVILRGVRNVVASSADFSGYAFLDEPRHYSPIASNLRAQPISGLGVSWRMDYDPFPLRRSFANDCMASSVCAFERLHRGITNNTISADTSFANFYISAGHNLVRSNPTILSPSSNQFRGAVRWGRANRRGWNTGFDINYDYRQGIMQFLNSEVTYNTDCCGFSFQWRRGNWGNEVRNQYRFSLAIANVGNFGTLKEQEKFF